jgi:error-prone DNA polymerase
VQGIVRKSLRDVQREELVGDRLMAVHGRWQPSARGAVKNLVATRLEDLTPLLGRLAGATVSRDFR